MGKRLYVGNLSYNTTEETLKSHFEQFGEVTSSTILKDKFSGRSRGFGFVEMATDEAAKLAVEKANGVDFEGRDRVVNEARPMEEGGGGSRDRRPGGGGGRGHFGGGRGRRDE